MRHAYPIMLDVTDRLIVIVGGGAVAARKARGVLGAGATRVRCVSPAFDADLPAPVERIEESYAPSHLDGAGLAFAATDLAAVNDAVVRDARTRGILVNRADVDEEDPGDFTLPATGRFGPATLAAWAGGNPALAVAIRDGLKAKWDDRWTQMADLMVILRAQFRLVPQLGPAMRRDIFRDLAGEEALNVLGQQGISGLIQWLTRRYPGLSGRNPP